MAKKNKAEYELGRYKKKCEDQSKEIRELQERESAWQQTVDVSLGVVAAIVNKVGTIQLTQDEINEAMTSVKVIDDYNAEKRTHTLTLREGSEENGN